MNNKQKDYLKSFRIEGGNITAFMSIDEIHDLYQQLQRLAWEPILKNKDQNPYDHDYVILYGPNGLYSFAIDYKIGVDTPMSFRDRATHFMPLPPTPKDD